jgi:hypothetical protein
VLLSHAAEEICDAQRAPLQAVYASDYIAATALLHLSGNIEGSLGLSLRFRGRSLRRSETAATAAEANSPRSV